MFQTTNRLLNGSSSIHEVMTRPQCRDKQHGFFGHHDWTVLTAAYYKQDFLSRSGIEIAWKMDAHRAVTKPHKTTFEVTFPPLVARRKAGSLPTTAVILRYEKMTPEWWETAVVNCHITNWKTTISLGVINYKWQFSIAMLVYQRVFV